MPTLTHSTKDAALSSEINVTPMIDVLLVLLIIFMAALPSMRKTMDLWR
jgi:biopolymer transport protein ExbD